MRFSLLFAVLMTIAPAAVAQSELHFFNSLINNETRRLSYDPADTKISQRLGITYKDAPNKLLIEFDFDDSTKAKLRSGALQFTTSSAELGGGFSKLTTEISNGQKKEFYFKKGKLISPASYHARDWMRLRSKHFEFWISDTTLFHPHAVVELERFFEEAADMLKLTASERSRLAKQKIIYIYCRDEDEIERLTGFKTRGIYLMSHDYVVTTYSCHYHEILHLLLNYKLKAPPLFTHPMLQEGFAVAFGGRGGIALNSLLQSGVFLHDSKFLQYTELLSANESLQLDASLTYPVHGLYVKFLFVTLGVEKFLSLYKRYGTTSAGLQSLKLSESDLPPTRRWEKFVDAARTRRDVALNGNEGLKKSLLEDSSVTIREADEYFHVRMKASFSLRPATVEPHYLSKRFRELLPNREYLGERFLFAADSNETTIYDLYLNNSVASFSSGFTLPQEKVRMEGDWFEFLVRKSVFRDSLNGMFLRTF